MSGNTGGTERDENERVKAAGQAAATRGQKQARERVNGAAASNIPLTRDEPMFSLPGLDLDLPESSRGMDQVILGRGGSM